MNGYIVFGETLTHKQLKDKYGITAKDIAQCAARTGNSSYWIGYEIEQLIRVRTLIWSCE